MTHFQKKLIELMDKHGLSENELSKQINVTEKQIQNWLVNKKQPNAKNLFYLAKFFQISSDYLIDTKHETNKN